MRLYLIIMTCRHHDPERCTQTALSQSAALPHIADPVHSDSFGSPQNTQCQLPVPDQSLYISSSFVDEAVCYSLSQHIHLHIVHITWTRCRSFNCFCRTNLYISCNTPVAVTYWPVLCRPSVHSWPRRQQPEQPTASATGTRLWHGGNITGSRAVFPHLFMT